MKKWDSFDDFKADSYKKISNIEINCPEREQYSKFHCKINLWKILLLHDLIWMVLKYFECSVSFYFKEVKV